MKQVEISVIIPFYGVEKYIGKCIESVKLQTFTNFECILIDDGSLDNSYKVAKECIKDDHRFRIIRQKNKGLGGARNTGVENAKGEYIAFLDSDDWWEKQFLEVMYTKAFEHNADIIVCGMKIVRNEVIIEQSKDNDICNRYNFSKEELLGFFLKNPTACNKLYRKSIWHNIRFPKHLYFEDLATTYKTVLDFKKVIFIPDTLYNYYKRINSITNYFNNKHIDDIISVFTMIEENLTNNNFQNEEMLIHTYFLHVVQYRVGQILKSRNRKEGLKYLKSKLDSKHFNLKNIWKVRKCFTSKSLIIFLLLYISPSLLSQTYYLKK